MVRDGATFTATAEGVLRWRGKRGRARRSPGDGTLDAMRRVGDRDASSSTSARSGSSAPRFLMFKMEDEVTVEVTIRGPVAS